MTERYVFPVQLREAFELNQISLGTANIQDSRRTLGIVWIEVAAPEMTARTLVDPISDMEHAIFCDGIRRYQRLWLFG